MQRAPEVEAPADTGAEEPAQVDILDRTALSLARHALPPRQAAARTLAQFAQLRRLDLSDMQASSEDTEGLVDLQLLALAAARSKKAVKKHGGVPLTERLTWLSVASNPALGSSDTALDGLDEFAALHGTSTP